MIKRSAEVWNPGFQDSRILSQLEVRLSTGETPDFTLADAQTHTLTQTHTQTCTDTHTHVLDLPQTK